MAGYLDIPEGFDVVNEPQTQQPQQAQSPSFSDVPEGFEVMQQPQASPQSGQQAPMSRGQAAFITATNPLNFGDEIKAGIAALTAKVFGGEATKGVDIGDLYKEARDTERQKLTQAKEQYPIQSALVGFGSDIPLEAAALGKMGLTGAQTMGGRIAQGAAGGGALGAIGGAGASEAPTMEGVGSDTISSGMFGAAAGGVLAPAIPAIGSVLGKGATGIKNLLTKKTGEQVAEQTAAKSISPEAAKQGLEQLKTSPEGQPTTAIDIDSPEFQGLLKTAVSKYPQSKKIAAEFAAGRKEEAVKRIDDLLSKDISPVDNYFGNLAEKQQLQKIRGKENYDVAYSFVPKGEAPKDIRNVLGEIDPFGGHIFKDKQLSDLITTRSDFTTKAAKEAADLAQIEDGIEIDPNELLRPSTKNVDMIKRGLDSLIDKETDALGKVSPKGRALGIYKNQLLSRMDELNPDYKKARNIYAGDFAVQKAQELGRKFDKMQPEEISIKMRGLGQSEKDAFRVGQKLRMQELADKSKTPAVKLFGNEQIKKQLAASFEGKEMKFKEFSQRLKEEIAYDQTIKNLGLNKQEVEAGKAGIINLIAKVASFGATGAKPGLVFEGARAAETAMLKNYKGLNEKSAKDLIRAFTNKQSSIRILQNIVDKAEKGQKPIIQEAIKDIYPAIIGGNLGVNFGDSSIVSDAGAADLENKSLEEIKASLSKQKQDYPIIGQAIDVEKDAQAMKQRYYR